MIRSLYDRILLIDSSAVLALHDPREKFHVSARSAYLEMSESVRWAVIDVTSHECYTKARYSSSYQAALEHYNFMRNSGFELLRYSEDDERSAESILDKYSDHKLSFHDALCAAVMKRVGVYKIFTFDNDFSVLGFEVIPGR